MCQVAPGQHYSMVLASCSYLQQMPTRQLCPCLTIGLPWQLPSAIAQCTATLYRPCSYTTVYPGPSFCVPRLPLLPLWRAGSSTSLASAMKTL
jgi:hypothetical protein